MKKYFIFSDVHNCFSALEEGLNSAGFDINNENHIIVSNGDAFDRGSQAHHLLDFFMNKIPTKRRIFIKGNHDDDFFKVLERGFMDDRDVQNGLKKTLKKLTSVARIRKGIENLDLWRKYYNESCNYLRLDNYVITHGWVPDGSSASNLDLKYPNIAWEHARWKYSPVEMRRNGMMENITIVVGHIHTTHFHDSHDIFYMKPCNGYCGVIAIDTCTNLTGKVNVLVIETKTDPILG